MLKTLSEQQNSRFTIFNENINLDPMAKQTQDHEQYIIKKGQLNFSSSLKKKVGKIWCGKSVPI